MIRFHSRWIAFVGLGGFGLAAVVAGAAGLASISWGPPRGVILPESRRVVAEEGQKQVSVSYRIENRGGSDLVIHGVETGCGCSVAAIEHKVISPGEGGTVTVEATVPPAGERSLEMVLKTSEPSNGELPFYLTVIGSASIPYVTWHTPVAQFGEIQDDSRSTSITLITLEQRGSDYWISKVEPAIPGLSVEGGVIDERLVEANDVHRTYHFELSFNEIPRPGRVSGQLSFLDSSGRPIVMRDIPILGFVRRPVSVIPAALFANLDPNTEPDVVRVSLVSASASDNFRVEVVDTSEGIIVEEIMESEGNPTFAIRPIDSLQERRGQLVFRTDVKGAERVEVPYLFRIRNTEADLDE